MKRFLRLLAIVALAVLGYLANDGWGDRTEGGSVENSARVDQPRSPASSEPVRASVRVDERHIFDGEINRRGEPVGFHARPGGREPADARVAAVRTGPNGLGVYVASVEIRDPRSGQWHEKRSSFFPDHLSREEVLAVIHHAWTNRERGDSEKWRGPSGLGFTVEGWAGRGEIHTAYPIYRRDRR